MLNMAYHARKRRRLSEPVARYTRLYSGGTVSLGSAASGVPINVTAAETPEAFKVGVSFSVPTSLGDIDVTQVSTVSTPALAADEVRVLNTLNAGNWTIVSAIAGVATIYVIDEWNKPFPILTATFT